MPNRSSMGKNSYPLRKGFSSPAKHGNRQCAGCAAAIRREKKHNKNLINKYYSQGWD